MCGEDDIDTPWILCNAWAIGPLISVGFIGLFVAAALWGKCKPPPLTGDAAERWEAAWRAAHAGSRIRGLWGMRPHERVCWALGFVVCTWTSLSSLAAVYGFIIPAGVGNTRFHSFCVGQFARDDVKLPWGGGAERFESCIVDDVKLTAGECDVCILAVGQFAVGIFALGQMSMGLVCSTGMLSYGGLISIGMLSFSPLGVAIGMAALGSWACGFTGIGCFPIKSCAGTCGQPKRAQTATTEPLAGTGVRVSQLPRKQAVYYFGSAATAEFIWPLPTVAGARGPVRAVGAGPVGLTPAVPSMAGYAAVSTGGGAALEAERRKNAELMARLERLEAAAGVGGGGGAAPAVVVAAARVGSLRGEWAPSAPPSIALDLGAPSAPPKGEPNGGFTM